MMNLNPETRIIDLTVGELVDVIHQAMQGAGNQPPEKERRLAYGIGGIAQIFNCSKTTANRIKSSGVIDGAISQYGRTITVDVDKALQLMEISKTTHL